MNWAGKIEHQLASKRSLKLDTVGALAIATLKQTSAQQVCSTAIDIPQTKESSKPTVTVKWSRKRRKKVNQEFPHTASCGRSRLHAYHCCLPSGSNICHACQTQLSYQPSLSNQISIGHHHFDTAPTKCTHNVGIQSSLPRVISCVPLDAGMTDRSANVLDWYGPLPTQKGVPLDNPYSAALPPPSSAAMDL